MRLYLAADAAALDALRDGGSVTLTAFAAGSEDEEDELAALESAAPVAVVVDVDEVEDGETQTITLEHVAALHVDADGSGDLAWYAAQEIDAVLELLA